MKIKEALIACFNKKGRNANRNGLFMFTWFATEITRFYVFLVAMQLEKDMPDAIFNNAKTGGKGTPFKDVTGMDILRVLKGEDYLRYSSLFIKARDFFEWYFDEDVPVDFKHNDGSYLAWNDFEFLVAKWNEYVGITAEERKETE